MNDLLICILVQKYLKIKLKTEKETRWVSFGKFLGLKNFLPAKLKYGSSRCFSPGSFSVFSGVAPPPFRIFAGGFFRQNALGLIQEYCSILKIVRTHFAACGGDGQLPKI